MKFTIKDLEYSRKVTPLPSGQELVSMKSIIEDENGNAISTSPFGSINEKFQGELAACETKQQVLDLVDKYFFSRLQEGIYKEMGVK
jgi:hypothetical protein